MRFKFFTVSSQASSQAEKELNDFCYQHRIIHIDKQIVLDGQNSFWSFCLTWQEGDASLSNNKKIRTPAVDYKKILNELDFSCYLELRNFRKEQAEIAAVPAYALFTNQQLADMVQERVNSMVGLQQIKGVGKSRVEKYGELFLQKLNELWGNVSDYGE